MRRERILIIEDDKDILELLRYSLSKDGFQPVCAETGEEGLKLARTEPINLIVLDLMLPDFNGFEICKLLRAETRTSAIPIIMVTAKGEEPDIVTGLELGASDYIVKPFSPRVLIARIKAVARRKSPVEMDKSQPITIGEIMIHPGRWEVTVAGTPVELTYTEFQILQFLATKPGWVFTRYQIIDAIKGEDYPVTDRAVDVQVVGLRKKLGDFGRYIRAVRGVGYRFMLDGTADAAS